MDFRNIDDWDEKYINELIDKKEKESVQLEFKGGDFLKNTPEGKFKLRKWVTSFANSAGGFFVIGVREKEEIEEINGKKVIKDEYPEEIDGIDKSKFTIPIRKWIEDTITDSTFPHLNPTPLVKTFTWSKDSNKEIAIIRIWQTNAVVHYVRYNGKEHYFHRHNFETVEMDEWEIRALLFGRLPPPIFQLYCEAAPMESVIKETEEIEEIKHDKILLKLTNEGFGIGKNIQIGMIYNHSTVIHNIKISKEIYLPDEEFTSFDMLPLSFKEIFYSDGKITITKIYYDRVLHSGDTKLFTFSLKIRRKKNVFEYKMVNRIGVFILSENSKPTYFGIEFSKVADVVGNIKLKTIVVPYPEDNMIKIE
jgi:hypothetical protein